MQKCAEFSLFYFSLISIQFFKNDSPLGVMIEDSNQKMGSIPGYICYTGSKKQKALR